MPGGVRGARQESGTARLAQGCLDTLRQQGDNAAVRAAAHSQPKVAGRLAVQVVLTVLTLRLFLNVGSSPQDQTYVPQPIIHPNTAAHCGRQP